MAPEEVLRADKAALEALNRYLDRYPMGELFEVAKSLKGTRKRVAGRYEYNPAFRSAVKALANCGYEISASAIARELKISTNTVVRMRNS